MTKQDVYDKAEFIEEKFPFNKLESKIFESEIIEREYEEKIKYSLNNFMKGILHPREYEIVSHIFGINDYEKANFGELALKYDRSQPQIKSLNKKALLKLKVSLNRPREENIPYVKLFGIESRKKYLQELEADQKIVQNS